MDDPKISIHVIKNRKNPYFRHLWKLLLAEYGVQENYT